jgi:putative ABC transport system substrate-binding protein
LRETGYDAGKDVAIEYRWAEGHYDKLPELAADLIRKSAAVIVAAPIPTALVAKSATQKIPIIFEGGADPIRFGLVTSLSRPDGNVTGIVNLSNTLVVKRLELMHQVVPNAASIAVLNDPGLAFSPTSVADLKDAASQLGVQLELFQVKTSEEIEAAFADVAKTQRGAMVVGVGPLFNSHVQEIAEFAKRYRVPASHELREFATAGGLLSYCSDLPDAYRLSGVYAGRVLRGEKPANLPVQQSTKIEMVINLNAAKALGITFPLPLLGRADAVIE